MIEFSATMAFSPPLDNQERQFETVLYTVTVGLSCYQIYHLQELTISFYQ